MKKKCFVCQQEKIPIFSQVFYRPDGEVLFEHPTCSLSCALILLDLTLKEMTNVTKSELVDHLSKEFLGKIH